MPKVYCPAVGCIHNKNEKCHAKKVSFRRRLAQNNGNMKVLWECETHARSDEYQELLRLFGGNVRGSEQKERMI